MSDVLNYLQNLAALVESADDAIFAHSLDGIIITWNQGATRLLGYTGAEAIGKPIALLVPPDSHEEMAAALNRLQRTRQAEQVETVRRRKDGSLVPVTLSLTPIRDPAGSILGVSNIVRKRKNETVLRFLSETRTALAEVADVSTAVQRVAQLAVTHFADCCAVDVREPDGSLRRLAVAHRDPPRDRCATPLPGQGVPDPEVPDYPLRTPLPTSPVVRPPIAPALARESLDGVCPVPGHEPGFTSALIVPVLCHGRQVGLLSFASGPSQQRYTDSDRTTAEELARQLALALENAQLQQELRQMFSRKDEHLAMLAHELRNPLAPIRNAVQILAMTDAPPGAIEYARQILDRQVQHLIRLVDDLLDVARLLRGRIALRREPVELSPLLFQAVEMARPLIDAQGQELIVSLPAEPVRLEADATRLVQVIANLLNNAARFSVRPGRIWLTGKREGSEAVLSVRDQGVGIRPELLPHIFDLFVQEDQSLERSRGGLGIGLTVARQLVELHGGTIIARSLTPERGSEFVVRLPASRS